MELLILTKSCPFFLDFLSSIGNNKVPPKCRSVQKTRTEQHKKKISPEKSMVSDIADKYFTVMSCVTLLCLSPHAGFSSLSVTLSAHRSKADITCPDTRRHTPHSKTTNGKTNTGTRIKHLLGNYKKQQIPLQQDVCSSPAAGSSKLLIHAQEKINVQREQKAPLDTD